MSLPVTIVLLNVQQNMRGRCREEVIGPESGFLLSKLAVCGRKWSVRLGLYSTAGGQPEELLRFGSPNHMC